MQFSHAPSDRDLAERLWAGRAERAYAWRSLAGRGAVVVNGSDAPIEELDPWAGIVAGVLRTLDERPAWQPEQALSIEQALAATWSSRRGWRARSGGAAGSSRATSPISSCSTAIRSTYPPDGWVGVVATMVGGRWVHNPPPWD